MRTSIAGAIVVVYIYLVSTVAFWVPIGNEEKLPNITGVINSHFTTIVGVVIAFYFGSLVYLKAHRTRSDGGKIKNAVLGNESN